MAPLGCNEWVEESERKRWRESDREKEGGREGRRQPCEEPCEWKGKKKVGNGCRVRDWREASLLSP